eukprot:11367302-Karenia_brevis.AAC.1
MDQTLGPASQQKDLTSPDLNMSCYYGKEKKEQMPCIVSTGTWWGRGTFQRATGISEVADRPLSAEEILSLQGFDRKMQSRHQPVNQEDAFTYQDICFCSQVHISNSFIPSSSTQFSNLNKYSLPYDFICIPVLRG